MTGQGPTEKSSRRASESAETLGRKSATKCGGKLKKKYDRRAAWKKRNPYARYLEYARRRCNDPKHPSGYFQKGLVCVLTGEQVKFMYDRDGAAKMKKPSIDRIDATLGYSFGNCRFVEFNFNSRRAWDPSAAPAPEPEFV